MKRFFEILPAVLSWLTLILMVVFSRFLPVGISIFIIVFDIYWLLKTVYLSLHMRATFAEMKRNMGIDWLGHLEADGQIASHLPWREIYHVVIFPMHNESLAVERESFLSLARVHYPMDRIVAVVGRVPIIESQVGNFLHWMKNRDVVPLIRQLRDSAEEARRHEVERALKALARGEDPKAILEALSHGITNKLLHAPTRALHHGDEGLHGTQSVHAGLSRILARLNR